MRISSSVLPSFFVFAITAATASAQLLQAPPDFVNWESPHVHPLEWSPAASRCWRSTRPDTRLEIFDASGALPVSSAAVPVGLDPVSVRARTADEAWVVNHVSDSDERSSSSRPAASWRDAEATEDEPRDVVFAARPPAWAPARGQHRPLFELSQLSPASPARVGDLRRESPRALAPCPPTGARSTSRSHASGNARRCSAAARPTTVIGFPPNVVSAAEQALRRSQSAARTRRHLRSSRSDAGQPRPPPGRPDRHARTPPASGWTTTTASGPTLVSGVNAPQSGRAVGMGPAPTTIVAVIDAATWDWLRPAI